MTTTTLKAKIKVDKNPIGLPKGTVIDMVIEVFEGYATFHTTNMRFTRDLVRTADPGEKAVYNERMQKTIVEYPNKTQQEIVEKLSQDLARLG